jgi:hypothetical protein
MNDDDKGPSGYTVKDLVYWSGLMGGVVVTYGILHALDIELHPLVRALLAIGVGVALGWTSERIYTRAQRPAQAGPRRNDQDINHIPGSPQ